MGRRVRMICTVGTSLVGPQSFSEDEMQRIVASEQSLIDYITSFYEGRKMSKEEENGWGLLRDAPLKTPEWLMEKLHQPDFGSYRFPDAEIQTVLRWMRDRIVKDKARIDELHLVFLPSSDKEKNFKSQLNAYAACMLLKRVFKLFEKLPEGTRLICEPRPYDEGGDILPVEINVKHRDEFIASIANLFKALDRDIKTVEEKRTGEEAVICSTGGYKSVSGFAMMYAQLHSIPCLYTFEQSEEAYEVMSLPLGYAYASLDEEINMLRAIQTGAAAAGSALPRWLRDSKELAGALLDSYESARRKPYGTGEFLFERLRDYGGEGPAWAEYLGDLLVEKWSQLWLGDQIPETVEHSRRHSKRLMEFTANLFRSAPGRMEALGFDEGHPENLALLIAAIYLHDIGHTALSYPILLKDPPVLIPPVGLTPRHHFLLREAASLASIPDVLPLGSFPSAVREVHHLLTGELLAAAPERYFTRNHPKDGDDERAAFLARCVPLVAAHHRGYTKLKAESDVAEPKDAVRNVGELLFGKEKFAETLRPLEARYKGDRPIAAKHLLNLTALLRVIDGCDVQADRVISQEYLDYRNQRSEDEARMLNAQIRGLEDRLPSDIAEHLEALRGRPDGETVKGACKVIYPRIFEELQSLRERHGLWRVAQQKDMAGFMALSLANRAAFKTEQRLHFKKHQSVSFVLPVVEGTRATVKIFPNHELKVPEEELMDALRDIKKDIDEEYEKTEGVLAGKLEFSAEIVGGKA